VPMKDALRLPGVGNCIVDETRAGLIARAVLRATQRDFGPEAERLNRAILELTSLDIAARNRLAQCLVARGARAEAAAECEIVLKIAPGNSIARNRLDDLRRARPAQRCVSPRGPSAPTHGSATVRPGGIDTTSESVAAAVIRGLYPSEHDRRKCLARLADSIRLVDHLSDYWEITLQRRQVTLNVSKLATVCFLPGKLRLLADKAKVSMDIWNLSVSIGGPPEAGLLSASNLEWIDLPSHRLDELMPRCQRAHEIAVLQASEGGRSSFLRVHSSGVVDFMNTTLGLHVVGP
jgi:hypothetical protein